MSINIDLITHYPWLPSLEVHYSILSSEEPSEFISSIFAEGFSEALRQRTIEIFKSAFENLEDVSDYKRNKSNVYLYLLLKILLFILNDKVITNRIANLYSKINYNDLINENDYNIYVICEDLKLKIQYRDEPWEYGTNILKDQRGNLITNFRIHYIDYLKLASKLRDDYRKLVNNSLSEGYVFIQKRSLIRLIQEYIREKLIKSNKDDVPLIENLKKELLKIDKFRELYDKILEAWKEKKIDISYSFDIGIKEGEDLTNIYPPCMKEILSKAQEGQNIPHTERLVILFFLHALNYPIDEIVNIFSTMPDFDRDKTTYQVKFAKRKNYTPHSCATLKSLDLCRASKYKDELCLDGYFSKKLDSERKINIPLTYLILKKKYKQFKKDTTQNKEPSKEND